MSSPEIVAQEFTTVVAVGTALWAIWFPKHLIDTVVKAATKYWREQK